MSGAETAMFPGAGSLLVVAHPDDEILWFGSIVAEVDKIVICFLNDPAHPELAVARERVLADHPLSHKIVCLGADETRAFNHANWPRPETTKYGLRIVKARKIARAYRLCFRQLKKKLAPMIREAGSVITHNPWGEYGHEEHVLVHRVVAKLAGARNKDVWYDNHASSWSEQLMRTYLDDAERPVVRRDVDTQAMESIADIYRRHGAWTWFDDYQWFEEEHFVRGPLQRVDRPRPGREFPVNLLRLAERH
jgi:LmbE family N-acetylglucosaminyl deacetylase